MKHIPHLVIPAPWSGEDLPVSVLQSRHLSKVLRVNRGDRVTYTDGLGVVGDGVLGGHVVRRGDEEEVPRSYALEFAVAPPASKERQRFLVEKLAEIGVARLSWLHTKHGKNRPPTAHKSFAWALSAVEQSRGAWLMEIAPDMTTWSELESPVVVCERSGGVMPHRPRTVVIGPEGGFAADEIPEMSVTWDLGPTVLRVETAATVAAARLLAGG